MVRGAALSATQCDHVQRQTLVTTLQAGFRQPFAAGGPEALSSERYIYIYISLLPPPLKKITYAKKILRNYFRGDCDGVA